MGGSAPQLAPADIATKWAEAGIEVALPLICPSLLRFDAHKGGYCDQVGGRNSFVCVIGGSGRVQHYDQVGGCDVTCSLGQVI